MATIILGQLGGPCKPATFINTGCDDTGVKCQNNRCMPYTSINVNQFNKLIEDKNLEAIYSIKEPIIIELYYLYDKDGMSPLMKAASRPDNYVIIHYILGILLKAQSKLYIFRANHINEQNALMLAIISNSFDNVKAILMYVNEGNKQYINDKDIYGKTALDYATVGTAIYNLLIEKGAIAAPPILHNNPLHKPKGGRRQSKTKRRLTQKKNHKRKNCSRKH